MAQKDGMGEMLEMLEKEFEKLPMIVRIQGAAYFRTLHEVIRVLATGE
jgi:hypothetical protein